MKKTVILPLLLAFAFVVSSLPNSQASGVVKNYIIIYKNGFSGEEEAKRYESRGKKIVGRYTKMLNGFTLKATSQEALLMKSNPNILSVEEEQIYKTSTTQNGADWGLDRIDQEKLPLDRVYNYTLGNYSVDAYVVDTGINALSTDFTGRVLNGFSAINDGNGTNDCNGHGTHVSGSIGGNLYGVNKTVNLIPIRVLDCAGSGTTTSVLAGLDFILANKNSTKPSIVNMSLGGGASLSLDQAVAKLISNNIAVVVAAGNDNKDACNFSPARVTSAITVGATDPTDTRATFSNYGTCLDVFAPGVNIKSVWIGGTATTATLSGTSMATPLVTGALTLLLSKEPTLTSTQIAERVKTSSSNVTVGQSSGSVNKIINNTFVSASPIAPILTKPNPPINANVIAGNRSANLSWTLTEDGGSKVSSIKVYYYQNNVFKGIFTLSGGQTALTVTNLQRKSSFYFKVAAVNSIGESLQSLPSNIVTIR